MDTNVAFSLGLLNTYVITDAFSFHVLDFALQREPDVVFARQLRKNREQAISISQLGNVPAIHPPGIRQQEHRFEKHSG
jgi:hypothetical protein